MIYNFIYFIDGNNENAEFSGATGIFKDNEFKKPIFVPKNLKNTCLVYNSTDNFFHGFKLVEKFGFRKQLHFNIFIKNFLDLKKLIQFKKTILHNAKWLYKKNNHFIAYDVFEHFFEFLGIGLILPVTTILIDEKLPIFESYFLSLSDYFNIEIMSLVLILLLLAFSIKTLFYILYNLYQFKFAAYLNFSIVSRLFNKYVYANYEFYLNRNLQLN